MKSVKKLKLEELNRIDVETFKETKKLPIVIVLDNFRSALNVGSIFRTSDAFLIHEVVLCGITATPPHKEILKTAIGANHSIDWSYEKSVVTAVKNLKNEGYIIVGIEQTNSSIPLNDFVVDVNTKYAILLGNEVEGLSSSVLEHTDVFIEIPQFGTKHSLNVSVCGGIVIYHFSKEFLKEA